LFAATAISGSSIAVLVLGFELTCGPRAGKWFGVIAGAQRQTPIRDDLHPQEIEETLKRF
jgi:hypothetical protein